MTVTSLAQFSDDEKREFCLMVSMGCDRETACKYLGKTAVKLRGELEQAPDFQRQLLRAEATSEFNHMRNIHNAAKDEKHWRVSVWWLERRSPERYGRRTPGVVTEAQLRQVLEELADAIAGEISDQEDRSRLLVRLNQVAQRANDELFEIAGTAEVELEPGSGSGS